MKRQGPHFPGTVHPFLVDRKPKPKYTTQFALTIADIMARAALTNLNASALTTYSSTTSRWDPVNNVIKYANQRRQRNFNIGGTLYAADLIESARTNLLAAGTSEHFERWTVGSGTPVVTTDTFACPNGEVVADTLTEGSGTGTHGLSQAITKAASSLAYVGSCYIKNKTGSREVTVELDDGTTTNGVSLRINPTTGALTSAPAAFGAGWAVNTAAGTDGYTITDVGGGWYRVSVVATSDTTTTVRFRVALYGGADSYAGDGTSAIYLWGADVNQAAFAASVCLGRNLLLQSETLNTTWTKTRATITSDSTADPITGNVTADTIVEDNTATNTHSISQVFTKAASALQFTFSVYLKQSGRTWAFVECTDTGITNGAGIYFDVANGVKGTAVALGVGWTLDSSTITAVGSWYRCTVTVTSNTATTIRANVFTATADLGAVIVTPLNAAALICWGAQLEYGPTATQYWATTTAGLRTADVLTSSLTSFIDARTNLLTYSEQFDNAAWSKTDTTVTANTGTDPNGNAFCDLLTEGMLLTAQSVSSLATITANATVAASCFVKVSSGVTWVRMTVASDSNTNGWRGWYNIATGAVGSQTVIGTGTAASISIANYGNGWYRLMATGKVDAAATTMNVRISSANNDASTTRVASAAYYAFGAQVELASSVGTYIPTGGTAITATTTGLSRTTGTLLAFVQARNWTNDQDGSTAWRIGSTNAAGTDRFDRSTVGAFRFVRSNVGGTQTVSAVSGTLSNGTLTLAHGSWSVGRKMAGINGTITNNAANEGPPWDAATSLSIGASSTGTTAFFGYVLFLYRHGEMVEPAVCAVLAANMSVP